MNFLLAFAAKLLHRSVNSIVADFENKVTQLDTVVKQQQHLKNAYAERILQLEKDYNAAEAEEARAAKVRNQIAKLISAKE